MRSQDYAQALYESVSTVRGKERDKRFDNFIKLLKSASHLHLLPQIITSFEELHKKEQRKNTIEVTTAEPLSETACRKLVQQQTELGDTSDKTVVCSTNPTLRGGYIMRSHTTQVDTSHKAKLLQLYQSLVSNQQ